MTQHVMTQRVRYMAIIFVLIVVASFAPLLLAVAAGWIANLGGCELNEGAIHSCVLLGIDLGGILYLMFVLGWLMLATLPLGALALLAWIVVAFVMYVRSKQTSRSAN